MKNYRRFPLSHKIFRCGPDTFGAITKYNYYEDMMSRYGGKLESVHNEYLQYLITIGIAGLIDYIGLLSTSVWKILQNAKKEPTVVAITSTLICCGAQTFVNISIPVIAPVMLTLIMIGLSAVRDTRPYPPEDTITGGLSRYYIG